MSVVTNLLLACDCGDAELDGHVPRGLAAVKAWCEGDDRGLGWPRPVDEVSGGTKHLETGLYAWGANYLAFDEFMEAVRTAPWRRPARVQVIVKGQEDDVFTTYTLTEKRTWQRHGPPSELEKYEVEHLEG